MPTAVLERLYVDRYDNIFVNILVKLFLNHQFLFRRSTDGNTCVAKCLLVQQSVLTSSFTSFCQTLAIDKWNTDSVEEFLDIYLMKEDEIEGSEQQAEALP